MDLPPSAVDDAIALQDHYRQCSQEDLFVLTLAKIEDIPLLSGDLRLRRAAKQEGVAAHGIEWLLRRMIVAGRITNGDAKRFADTMRRAGRSVPPL